jgi:hypothetical protein
MMPGAATSILNQSTSVDEAMLPVRATALQMPALAAVSVLFGSVSADRQAAIAMEAQKTAHRAAAALIR